MHVQDVYTPRERDRRAAGKGFMRRRRQSLARHDGEKAVGAFRQRSKLDRSLSALWSIHSCAEGFFKLEALALNPAHKPPPALSD